VLLLAQAFLKRFAVEDRKNSHLRFTRQALFALAKQNWPGNVRQLENCVRRAVILSEGRYVTEGDLGFGAPREPAFGPRLKDAREAVERQLIEHALRQHGGNIRAAAEGLGVSRPTLYELIERLGIRRLELNNIPVS
jgi:two-component system NtrC family response regulator